MTKIETDVPQKVAKHQMELLLVAEARASKYNVMATTIHWREKKISI